MPLRLFPEPSPALRPFQSLLLRGYLPPSVPIHLCISHLEEQPQGRVVLITPSRAIFARSLRDANERWMREKAGASSQALLTRRTHMFYPPTIAHLKLCINMLRGFDGDPTQKASGKAILDTAPTLIVLHNISSYFIQHDSTGPQTISTYVSIVMDALQAAQSITANGAQQPSVAVIDSALDELSLPLVILPNPSIHHTFPTAEDDTPETPVDLALAAVNVAAVIERYSEWSGVGMADIPDGPDLGMHQYKLTLTRHDAIHAEIQSWVWEEQCDARGTCYEWHAPVPVDTK